MLPLATTRSGHGIGEAEGDELHQAGIIAVRQVTALVPAEEAESFFLFGQRPKRFVLRVNQLAQILTFVARNHIGAPNSDSARWVRIRIAPGRRPALQSTSPPTVAARTAKSRRVGSTQFQSAYLCGSALSPLASNPPCA